MSRGSGRASRSKQLALQYAAWQPWLQPSLVSYCCTFQVFEQRAPHSMICYLLIRFQALPRALKIWAAPALESVVQIMQPKISMLQTLVVCWETPASLCDTLDSPDVHYQLIKAATKTLRIFTTYADACHHIQQYKHYALNRASSWESWQPTE